MQSLSRDKLQLLFDLTNRADESRNSMPATSSAQPSSLAAANRSLVSANARLKMETLQLRKQLDDQMLAYTQMLECNRKLASAESDERIELLVQQRLQSRLRRLKHICETTVNSLQRASADFTAVIDDLNAGIDDRAVPNRRSSSTTLGHNKFVSQPPMLDKISESPLVTRVDNLLSGVASTLDATHQKLVGNDVGDGDDDDALAPSSASSFVTRRRSKRHTILGTMGSLLEMEKNSSPAKEQAPSSEATPVSTSRAGRTCDENDQSPTTTARATHNDEDAADHTMTDETSPPSTVRRKPQAAKSSAPSTSSTQPEIRPFALCTPAPSSSIFPGADGTGSSTMRRVRRTVAPQSGALREKSLVVKMRRDF